MRWSWAEIDLAAITHNVGVVRRAVAPAAVWAVVKADGYGHGVIGVANAALAAGASGLCVALVDEGLQLRRAGITARVLVLSEQPVEQAAEMVAADLTPTVYSSAVVAALADAGAAAGRVVAVHLKIDTGMHRVGVAPVDALPLADAIAAAPSLRLEGIFTHLACADEPDSDDNFVQLQRFEGALSAVRAAGHTVALVHAANSAAALALPTSHHDLVRLGVAMYGIEPGPGVADRCRNLRAALSLRSRVSMVKRVSAGERISYGLRHRFVNDAVVATVPIGYADGYPRLLSNRGEVLIAGKRAPVRGRVSMDLVAVDCTNIASAKEGSEAVLIGESGKDELLATELATWAETIAYEVLCGISPRVPRLYLED